MMRFLVVLGCLLGSALSDTLYFQPMGKRDPSEGAEQVVLETNGQICDNGSTICTTNQTCCKMSSGDYGCCHSPKAVCCPDGRHCCPQKFRCAQGDGACVRGKSILPLLETLADDQNGSVAVIASAINLSETANTSVDAAVNVSTVNVSYAVRGVCPDKKSMCGKGNTCCKEKTGGYGCCPVAKAVCCADLIHCCPEGSTCDAARGNCIRGDKSLPMVKKLPAQPAVSLPGNVTCPDSQFSCPDLTTCCKLASGKYGCCPYPKAVCCSDGTHCCPYGQKCDVSKKTCVRPKSNLPLTKTVSATPIKPESAVMCPGGLSQCPDGDTCCKMVTGGYGCCPLPQAVCCADHTHCCPSKYACHEGHCVRGVLGIPWVSKQAASSLKSSTIICSDGRSRCPSGNTCCRTADDKFACCPLPAAVCCSDRVHCCPNGYSCRTGSCEKGEERIKWMSKVPAMRS